MSLYSAIVFTAQEVIDGMALNNGDYDINPRPLDGSMVGVGINTNDQAENYQPGDTVDLTGTSIAAARLINDPDYQTGNAPLTAYCAKRPIVVVDTDIVFAQ